MITKIDHIGVAVKNIDEAIKLYTDALGLKVKDIEVFTEAKMKAALIPVGESMIELLESTDPQGALNKFIEKKGEGLHHIALGVTDIKESLRELTKKGIPLIDEKPRKGAGNSNIAFLHPKGPKVMIELVEPSK